MDRRANYRRGAWPTAFTIDGAKLFPVSTCRSQPYNRYDVKLLGDDMAQQCEESNLYLRVQDLPDEIIRKPSKLTDIT
jgi:hypothetical protein